MSTLTEKPIGSSNPAVANNERKQEEVAVRHIAGFIKWFVPDENLQREKQLFDCGIMQDVTFNPNAPVMTDVFCGSERVSEAEAIGKLEITEQNPIMPQDVVRRAYVDYDAKRKVFFEKDNPENIITRADYLLLHSNHSNLTAEVGWKS